MKIDLKWEKPFKLHRVRDGDDSYKIYDCLELERILNEPGVYIFGRVFGKAVVPLYIGQAAKLKDRVRNHLEHNLRLMKGLENAEIGHRLLLIGLLRLHPGQREGKVLDIVERALIKRALADGHDLLNKQGVKKKVHEIKSKGNNASRQIVPLSMLVER